MNAHTGEWQLQRIILKYSETAGSSLGIRYHFYHLLPRWKQRNPQVEIITQHSQFEHPEMTCHFRSGEACTVSLKNATAKQIEAFMDLYRNSESPNLFLKHGGPRVWTERRSIQGLWQPSFELMANCLKWAHKRDRKKMRLYYSDHSLKLSKQAIRGHGRWGDESVARRGFDREVLRAVFSQPFLQPRDPENKNRIVKPVETKESLPLKVMQAIQGHVSDAPTEVHRAQIMKAQTNLISMVIKRKILYKMRKKVARARAKKFANGSSRSNFKQNKSKDGKEESDSNSELSAEEIQRRKNEYHEERRLKNSARKATQKMVESKLAAAGNQTGVSPT